MSANNNTGDKACDDNKRQPFPCLLQRAATEFANEIAIISQQEQLTFIELESKTQALGRYFVNQGIRNTDRVIISLSNSIELMVSLLALIRIGAVACPINPGFPSKLKERLLRQLDTSWVIGSREGKQTPHDISLSSIRCALESASPTLSNTPILYSPRVPSSIILTSGTRGIPKAATFSYAQHYYSALGANELIPLGVGDRSLISLPLFHIAGIAILFRSLMAGSAIVLPNGKDLSSNIHLFKVTHASMVAAQLQRVTSQHHDHTSLKHVLVGGGPVDPELLKTAANSGLNCWHTYGLTEMASQVFTQQQQGSGHILNHRELRLSDQGEILVKGDTLFLGYYEHGELNLPLDAKGWFATNDLGKLYDDKRLEIIGRKDNQFISGGENIQPEEIEFYINKLKGVNQSIVVGHADSEYGLQPVVFIESEEPISLQKLNETLQPQLPGFKIPKAVYPLKLASGLKPSRIELQDAKINK